MTQNIFESGSCWLKADFHLHTRADKEFRYVGHENDYIKQYIDTLQAADIKLGVITNHNKFDLNEFKQLKKSAKKVGIGLLPGLELSVKDGSNGIHTLVIFSDEWINNKEQHNYIQDFLAVTFSGINNFEDENARSNHDLIHTIRTLDNFDKDYFLIFAHVEEKNGLWGGLSNGRIKELFESAEARERILGFQKVRTNDKRNLIKSIIGEYYPAEVEGCDPKQFSDFTAKKHATYIKLGDFSFEALKYALQDKNTRVRTTPQRYTHSYIEKITFEGVGALGGTEINFSPELNTLIGIRGSGKSSVLEAIRYALNIPFGIKSSDKEYKESLIKYMLGSGGKICITAIDRRNQRYEIKRILGERPDVFIENEIQQGVSIRETILHKPIYFGQKDLSTTGDGFEKDLIEKLLSEALVPVRQKIEQESIQVANAIRDLKQLSQFASQKQEWIEKKQDTEFKLQFYTQHNVETKLEKQIAFQIDEKKINQMISISDNYWLELTSLLSKYEDELKDYLLYKSEHNHLFFNNVMGIYQNIINLFDSTKLNASQIKDAITLLKHQLIEFDQYKEALKEDFAKIEQNLANELRQAGAQSINPDEYKKLKVMFEQAEQMLKIISLNELKTNHQSTVLDKALTKLNQSWHEEYQEVQAILSRINQDGSALSIEAEFKTNKTAMLLKLQETIKGSKIRETTLKNLVSLYTDFSAIYRDKEGVNKHLGTSSTLFWEYFEANLEELLTWQIPNIYTIKYHGKPLQHHSLGQRASALMLFVLSQQDNDLVFIDQPEDDLDNQTIYNDVIKLIRKLKPNMQFIFATHNANIPVLGDAEQIIACKYENQKVQTETGSIDSKTIQKNIIAIMEGGSEAFEKRKQVYQTWKPLNS